jgi:hypothetical protein
MMINYIISAVIDLPSLVHPPNRQRYFPVECPNIRLAPTDWPGILDVPVYSACPYGPWRSTIVMDPGN